MGRFKQICFLLIVIFLISCSPNKNYLPEDFFGLQLTKKLTGKDAKEFVNNLHFQNVTDMENEIGFYGGEAGDAIIYITHYNNKETAKGNYKKMVMKISPENSIFVNPEYLKLGGMEIYYCFGMGQSHYVFPYNKELFWISVDTHLGKKFVEDYLPTLNGI
ncbi:MAG: hypothetical protein WBH40_12065 [Ignavibacteriaceae bacterium]|jgi:hypothetical protein